MGKQKVLWASVISASLLLAACGNEEKTTSTQEKEKPKTEQTTKGGKNEEKNSSSDSKASESKTSETKNSESKGSVLNTYIGKESQGTVNVVYTNKTPKITHDMAKFKLSIDEYQIVHVKDMHKDATIPFKDQTEGYVITAKVTLDNQSGKDAYFNTGNIMLQSKDAYNFKSATPTLVEKSEQLKSKEVSKFETGTKVTGLVNFLYTVDEFKELTNTSPKLKVQPAAFSKDFKERAGQENVFEFPVSNEAEAKAENNDKFYKDRLVIDNMADRKMIFNKEGINKTEKVGDVNVTLEGVQYTELTPTESYKEAFKNFGDSGVVALAVKFKLDNTSSQSTSATGARTKLHIDDNRGILLPELHVEPKEPNEIKPGEKGEKISVFLFRKDEFNLYKKFTLEFGPTVDMNAQDTAKGQTVKFELPR
ncbi:DUF5068 domain-containing protein [Bacillus cereus]|uniref:DUF5068 domain-containing protein n=1 Tax=Bacillus cereus TaxID=1396 RepID=UPI00397EBD7E